MCAARLDPRADAESEERAGHLVGYRTIQNGGDPQGVLVAKVSTGGKKSDRGIINGHRTAEPPGQVVNERLQVVGGHVHSPHNTRQALPHISAVVSVVLLRPSAGYAPPTTSTRGHHHRT